MNAIRQRAAIIGHTGQGNYGHGLDRIFLGDDRVKVVAIADPNEMGGARVAKATGGKPFVDYRVMLEKTEPDLVVVAPRWNNQHLAMGLAALHAGAHVLMEKPFMQSVADADLFVAEAGRRGCVCCLATQMRNDPGVLQLKKQLDEGALGRLLEFHLRAKTDARAGGEDLIVHGPHLFDLLRFFAGEPEWCTSRVLHKGREATRADAKTAIKEDLGLLIGDCIHAQFAMANGVHATFTNDARHRGTTDGYGFTMVTDKTDIRLRAGYNPAIEQRHTTGWRPWADDPRNYPAGTNHLQLANRRLLNDWLTAIEKNREPNTSVQSALRNLEMIQAITEAGLKHDRVSFPLKNRKHPLK